MEKKDKIVQMQNLLVNSYNQLKDRLDQNCTRMFNGPQGHGLAAESANHVIDKLLCRNAVLTNQQIKNGCDRIVNKIQIQTKYCKSAQATYQNCFDKGQFRYPGQVIEVPPEQFDAFLAKLKKNGQTNVEVRKGHVSYKTAKAIAKSGTVEGLTYDAFQGVQLAVKGLGISAVCQFAYSIWSGKSVQEAFIDCLKTSAQIFGNTLICYIIVQQFARSSLNRFAHIGMKKLLQRFLSPSNFDAFANSFRKEGQRKIFGAAAKQYVTRMVKDQAIFALGMLTLQTGSDFLLLLKGKISGKQLAKNCVCNYFCAGGGVAGTVFGNVICGPVGGIIGGIVGGVVSQKAAKAIVDLITLDDLEKMAENLRQVIQELQMIYMLFEDEMNQLIDNLQSNLLKKDFLQQMFEQKQNSLSYARQKIKPYFKTAISKREQIQIEFAKDIDNLVASQGLILKASL